MTRKPYHASITWYARGDDSGYDEQFDTLDEAVLWIERWASGRESCRAWVNNKRVHVHNGVAVDDAGNAICTNPVWHEVFATPADRIMPV